METKANNNSDGFAEHLCNFEELVNVGDGQKIDIVVPKIQRSYAQGRKREKSIRESFVSQMLDSLTKGEEMELNFIYGSKRQGEYSTTYELLDGQQRLTTLFLFYWYFSMVEGGGSPLEVLKHFSYETRTTSADFIRKLVASTIDVTMASPRGSIRGKKWYTTAYDKDPTVEGMLTMLDTIHAKYCAMGKPSGILANLSKIKFYEMPLENFGLTEEIYIKMNARGLQLTPFENFKADLMKYMKDEQNPNYKEEVKIDKLNKTKAPYYLRFVQKMDAKWIDLFWSKKDEDDRAYCDRFFRFFYRYIATKYYLEVNTSAAMDFRTKKFKEWEFLHEESETQSSDNVYNVYLGFEVYKRIFDEYPEYIYNIEAILDTIQEDHFLKALILGGSLESPWDNEVMQFFDKTFPFATGVMFCAITEYIEASKGNIDTINLKRWLRVVWNCMEDQLFRNVNELVSRGRDMSKIIRTPGATEDLYHAMAKIQMDNDGRAIKEELKKACMIAGQPDVDWEAAFIEAEKHPFFRGFIGWFLFANAPATPEDFRHRTEIIGSMFDESGIVEELRKEHTLIIAMMRQLNSYEKMGIEAEKKLPITENKCRIGETDYLKSFLNGKGAVQTMFCNIGDLPTREDAIDELKSIVSAPISFETSSIEDNPLKYKLSKAFMRLATDKKIYDFIGDKEKIREKKNPKPVSFQFMYNRYYVVHLINESIKLYIDSDRRLIIPRIIEDLGYYIHKENSSVVFDYDYSKYDDYCGIRIHLSKVKEDSGVRKEVHVMFSEANAIDVSVLNPSEEFLKNYNREDRDEHGWVCVKHIEYETIADYNNIKQQIQEIEQLYGVS